MTGILHTKAKYAVLTSKEMKALEDLCIAQGDSSTDMMERAGTAVAEYILENFSPCKVLVLCGPGNNGGDGYVTALKLSQTGWNVIIADHNSKQCSSVAAEYHRKQWPKSVSPFSSECLSDVEVIVDALFGTGLDRPLEGQFKDIIKTINNSNCFVVSVDCPSGINSDTGQIMGAAIRANATVAISNLKPGHLLLPGLEFAGDVEVADINLSGIFENHQLYFNHPDLWKASLPHPSALDHKYSRGHVLMVGGMNLIGAGLLSSKSARRMGAGAVTLACDKSVATLYASSSPGLITKPIEDFEALVSQKHVSAVLLGPGNGVNHQTKQRVLNTLKTGIPCVIDADALTVFTDEPKTLINALHENAILTPHEGEYVNLFGPLENKVQDARRISKTTGATLLIKGADTVISHPSGMCLLHTIGTSDLATAGSGDVLAGAISGLLSQNMDHILACAAGAWAQAHAAVSYGSGVIAEDLPDLLPKALAQ